MSSGGGGSVAATARLVATALLQSQHVLPAFLRTAFQKFSWNALLVFNLRAAVALLLRILTVLRTRPRSVLDLNALVGEDKLRFRLDAVRLGLFVGAFSGLYSFLRQFLSFVHARVLALQTHARAAAARPAHANNAGVVPVEGDSRALAVGPPPPPPVDTAAVLPTPTWVTFASAALAGVSFVLLGNDEGNRSIALYTGARALECSFKLMCHHDFLSIARVADSPIGYAVSTVAVFALCTGQVMYAYVMRPETLPPSYWNFIVKMGPIAKPVLTAVRQSCRGVPVDVAALSKALDAFGYDAARDVSNGAVSLAGPPRPIALLSSGVLRPRFNSSVVAVLDCLKNTFSRSFPVYLSLSLGPSLVLRFKKFLRDPLRVVFRAFVGASRSSLFLGALCSMYYAVALGYRDSRLFSRDNRFLYYFAGCFAATSLVIEKESRRMELVLYVVPRAIDSLCQIIVDRRILPSIPGLDLALFCTSMATIVTSFEHYPSTVNPWVSAIAARVLRKDPMLESPSAGRTLQDASGGGGGSGDSGDRIKTAASADDAALAARVERLLSTIDEDPAGEATARREEEAARREGAGADIAEGEQKRHDEHAGGVSGSGGGSSSIQRSGSEPHWLDSGIPQFNR